MAMSYNSVFITCFCVTEGVCDWESSDQEYPGLHGQVSGPRDGLSPSVSCLSLCVTRLCLCRGVWGKLIYTILQLLLIYTSNTLRKHGKGGQKNKFWKKNCNLIFKVKRFEIML